MLAKGSLRLILPPLILGITCLSIFIYLKLFLILILSLLLFIITLFFVGFFRDPEREVGEGIVSPADGKIIKLEKTEKLTRIAIFMSLWDVHVNRAPLDCKIIKITHKPGKYYPAYSEKSVENERLELELETEIGQVKLLQIAGAFARRIVSWTEENEKLKKGQRIGMIRFGSGVELYLPSERIDLRIALGDKVLAGKTTLALIK